MADGDLKVFISWSGDLSREITKVIRHWLPKIFDRIDPWMSDVDIQAGRRGLAIIEERLNTSQFGIIVVTVENMEKTWLNFEAGALSKKFGDNVLARVVPIMADFDDVYQIKGPIHQFQAVKLDKDGMQSLLESITQVTDSNWESVKTRFEWSWDEFETDIQAARNKAGEQPKAPPVTEKELLERILATVTAPPPPPRSKAQLPKRPNRLYVATAEGVELLDDRIETALKIMSAYGIDTSKARIDGHFIHLNSSQGVGVERLGIMADEIKNATGISINVNVATKSHTNLTANVEKSDND